MAKVQQRVYTRSKERTMQSMLEVCEHTFEEMGMEIRTQYLDKSLIEVQGFPPKGSPLGKKNVLTVYKEGDKIFIKLTYEMKDPNQFWDVFETNLSIYGANTEEIEEKAMVVRKITETIEKMGGTIDPEEVWDFLYHYEKKFKKLPDDSELDAIALDYIRLQSEKAPQVSEEDVFMESGAPATQAEEEVNSPETDVLIDEDTGVMVTRMEALMEMIREIPTLDDELKNYYLGLFEQLTPDEQELLVKKVIMIEKDLNKVPYLTDEDRKKLHKEVMHYDTAKRRKYLTKIIQKRKKNPAPYMNEYMKKQTYKELSKIPTLDEDDIEDIMNVMITMPLDKKEKIAQIVQEIEENIQKMVRTYHLHIDPIEWKNLRLELLRLDEGERKKQFDEILENYKREHVKEVLFSEIPELRYEENEKIIKELLWLSDEELRKRIDALKEEREKEKSKRSKVFEESAVGTTCPKCGWPLGQFSRKCPRCGYNLDDEWFNI